MNNQSKKPPLRGTFVALVTPFSADGSVDEAAVERMVEHVIAGSVEGIVPCGTTGEKSTLNDDEHRRMIERVIALADGRVPVIAGTGSNDTRHAAEMARFAREVGATAGLSVCPYYNKPTQEGLVRHYQAIAEHAQLPLVVYNIPSRTGTKMTAETLLRLAEECPLVSAVKDATGDLGFAAEVLRNRPEGFSVLSGDDSGTLALVAMGGDGVISVIANEVPGRFSAMVRAALDGRFDEARAIFFELLPLMNANFIETNPIPVKAVLAMMGLIGENYRLPLCPMSPANRDRLRRVAEETGLIPPS
jgi:4-hydroxy-tetrahydrodipicolinate synthase